MEIITITLSSVAGAIFFYVLFTYDSRSRFMNTLLVFIASIMDIYPVFFSSMVKSVSVIGAFHGLVTLIAYIILLFWVLLYIKDLYVVFCYIWLLAYMSGYLAGAT